MTTLEKLHSSAMLALGVLAIVASLAGWPSATAILAGSVCWCAWRSREVDTEPATIIECELADGEQGSLQ